jgi:hypothetical protein
MKTAVRMAALLLFAGLTSACWFPIARVDHQSSASPEVTPLRSASPTDLWSAPTITCSLAYRHSTTKLPKNAKLVVDDWGAHKEFAFEGLHVRIAMSTDAHEPSVTLTTGSGSSRTSTSYFWASGTGPGNPVFAGWGFTGLVLVHGRGTDGPEIQVSCRSNG